MIAHSLKRKRSPPSSNRALHWKISGRKAEISESLIFQLCAGSAGTAPRLGKGRGWSATSGGLGGDLRPSYTVNNQVCRLQPSRYNGRKPWKETCYVLLPVCREYRELLLMPCLWRSVNTPFWKTEVDSVGWPVMLWAMRDAIVLNFKCCWVFLSILSEKVSWIPSSRLSTKGKGA